MHKTPLRNNAQRADSKYGAVVEKGVVEWVELCPEISHIAVNGSQQVNRRRVAMMEVVSENRIS